MKTLPILTLLLLAGCGGADGLGVGVAGRVSYDGQPVQEGSIAFIPADAASGPSAGAVIYDGRYEIDAAHGPAPGPHRVEIIAQRKTGRQIRDAFQPGPDNLVDEIEQFLPVKYNRQSDLTVTLEPGSNEGVDFHLDP